MGQLIIDKKLKAKMSDPKSKKFSAKFSKLGFDKLYYSPAELVKMIDNTGSIIKSTSLKYEIR